MNRNKLVGFLLLYLFCISGVSSSDNQINKNPTSSAKVLFLGNSLTGIDLPDVVAMLTENTTNDIYVDKLIRSGRSLYEISQTDDFAVKVSSDKWDFIVMQDSPYRVAYPDSFKVFPTRNAIEKIKSIVHNIYEETKLIFFMPYAYKDGMSWYQDYTDDFYEMQQKIFNYSIILANDYKMKIAPVGWAWLNVMSDANSVELYLSDMAHPTSEGTYLSACVIYSSIFEEELINNDYVSNISSASANYLQNIASSTVMNELEQWNYLSSEIDNNFINDNFILHQNYPNPFNPTTTISFDISQDTNVNVSVYDLLGNIVIKLLDKSMVGGTHKIKWNGIDNYGEQVSAGVYLYTIQTDALNITKKMILLR